MGIEAYIAHHRASIDGHRAACRAAREDVLRRLERVEKVAASFPSLERLYLFGSVLTERFQPESDVDLACSGVRGRDYFALWRALEDVVGRPLDLVDLDDQRAGFREAVTSGGRLLYEKR